MNANKLKGKLREHGYTYESLSEKIGICKTSFYKKINAKSVFTLPEVKEIIKELNLKDREVIEVFFN